MGLRGDLSEKPARVYLQLQIFLFVHFLTPSWVSDVEQKTCPGECTKLQGLLGPHCDQGICNWWEVRGLVRTEMIG